MPGEGDLPDSLTATVNAEIQRLIDAAPKTPSSGLDVGPINWQQRAAELSNNASIATSTSPRQIGQAAREIEAVRLRLKGLDYRSIARQMGMVTDAGAPKVQTVHKMVTRALQRWFTEETNELRTIEMQRLDYLTERCWKIIDKEGGKGDDDRALRAIEKYMMISARRAALAGLDAPKATIFKGEATVEHSGAIDVNVNPRIADRVELVNEYLELVDEVVSEEIRRREAETYFADAIDVDSEEIEPLRDDFGDHDAARS